MEGPGAAMPRNRLAVAGARATTQAMLRNQPRGDVIRNAVFAGLLLLAVLIALAGLLALLIQAFAKGSSALSPDLLTNPPSTAFPERAGFRPAIIGSLELIAGVILFVIPVGIGAALYLEEYADKHQVVEPPDRSQHPKPRRGALDHLRHPRSRLHRPRAPSTSASSSPPAP